MKAEVSLTELLGSVNGFDELAVEKHFGIDLYVDNASHPMKVARAAVFVHLRHTGVPDAEAREQAMTLGTKGVDEYFLDEPDEAMPEEPVTELGKGFNVPASELTTSPPSVSPLVSSPASSLP